MTTESTPFYSYGEILSDIEVLDVTTMSEEEARELLEAEEIEVYVKQDGNLLMNESNVNTSIVKSIMDQVKQTTAMGLDAFEYGLHNGICQNGIDTWFVYRDYVLWFNRNG